MNPITRSALLDTFATIFYWGATGAVLAHWLGKGDRVSFYLFLAGLACSLLNWRLGFAATRAQAADKIDAMRFRGEYPRVGEGSDDDVRRLKATGQKVFAVQLFHEIHGVTLRDAKRAIDAL